MITGIDQWVVDIITTEGPALERAVLAFVHDTDEAADICQEVALRLLIAARERHDAGGARGLDTARRAQPRDRAAHGAGRPRLELPTDWSTGASRRRLICRSSRASSERRSERRWRTRP